MSQRIAYDVYYPTQTPGTIQNANFPRPVSERKKLLADCRILLFAQIPSTSHLAEAMAVSLSYVCTDARLLPLGVGEVFQPEYVQRALEAAPHADIVLFTSYNHQSDAVDALIRDLRAAHPLLRIAVSTTTPHAAIRARAHTVADMVWDPVRQDLFGLPAAFEALLSQPPKK